MSTEKGKRQRRRSTRARRTSRTPGTEETLPLDGGDSSHAVAREHYRREKERRAARTRPPEHPYRSLQAPASPPRAATPTIDLL